MATRRAPWSRGIVAPLAVLLAIGTLTLVRPPAAAADDITVTVTADGGAGSLRDAFSQASASIAAANTITLAVNENYTLDSCVAADGDLDYTSGQPLTIIGNGSTIRQTCAGERVIESDGDITIQDTTITGGDGGAGSLGGGIEADTSGVTLVRTTVSANTGGTGGGVGAINVVISDSTIAGNQASSSGGGVWADQTVSATNSTITANTAAAGGGIALVNTAVTLRYVTIAGNTAPTGANIELQPGSDSLVSFASVISQPLGGGADCVLAAGATTTSQGHNVTTDASCDLTGSSDATAPDPGLGALAENGGPTRTRPPMSGSPLLDVVPCGDAPVPITSDQRGVTRPQGVSCDVGAVEVEVSTTTPVPTPVAGPGTPASTGSAATGTASDGARLRFAG